MGSARSLRSAALERLEPRQELEGSEQGERGSMVREKNKLLFLRRCISSNKKKRKSNERKKKGKRGVHLRAKKKKTAPPFQNGEE